MSDDYTPSGVDDPRIAKTVILDPDGKPLIELSKLDDETREALVGYCWKHNVGILKGVEMAIREGLEKDERKP